MRNRGGALVPAGSGDRAVSAPRHPGSGLAHSALPDRPSRTSRRPRPGRTRLGDPRGRREMGHHADRGERHVRCRRHLGDPQFRTAPGGKSSLYRDEVTEAAVACVIEAIGKIERGVTNGRPLSEAAPGGGTWRPAIKIEDRAIDWSCDDDRYRAAQAPRRVRPAGHSRHAFSGFPHGFTIPGRRTLLRGPPGAVIARRDGAICRATIDGAVWITAITPDPAPGTRRFKIPATLALAGRLDGIPERPIEARTDEARTPFAKSPTGRRMASAGFPSSSSTARCRSSSAAGCSTPTDMLRRAPPR